jgi:DNA invertase Pin-like site-specific DNA recombinase
MNGAYVGYARVSRAEQHLERQLENLNQYSREHNITFKRIFSEKISSILKSRLIEFHEISFEFMKFDSIQTC